MCVCGTHGAISSVVYMRSKTQGRAAAAAVAAEVFIFFLFNLELHSKTQFGGGWNKHTAHTQQASQYRIPSSNSVLLLLSGVCVRLLT